MQATKNEKWREKKNVSRRERDRERVKENEKNRKY